MTTLFAFGIRRFGLASFATCATLLLTGCFSMSAVPPAAGLAPLESPDGHDTARLDVTLPAEIESQWGDAAEFILLHPTINGHDVGWFIFDTGASGCTITADAARQAGLPAVGTTLVQGSTATTVFRSDVLTLGPLTLTGLHLTGLNMNRSSAAFGRPVVGILGRNVCSSATVEINGPERIVRLHPSGDDAGAPASGWVPIELRTGLTWVRCQYAGVGDGRFVIDTGADATVHFLGSAVDRHGLTDAPGVMITGSKTQITFGSIGRIKEGEVTDFRIGGVQFGPLEATFARVGDSPSRVLPDADGLIGMGLMRSCVVILDEPHARASFVPRPDTR